MHRKPAFAKMLPYFSAAGKARQKRGPFASIRQQCQDLSVDFAPWRGYAEGKRPTKEVNCVKKLILLLLLLALPLAALGEDAPLRLSPDFQNFQGHITFYWQDDAAAPPYTLTWQCAEDTPDAQPEFVETDIASTFFTVDYLAPGMRYLIGVTNSRGDTAQEYISLPQAATFEDGKLNASHLGAIVKLCSWSRQEEDGEAIQIKRPEAASMEEGWESTQYGIRFELRYPELAGARTLDTLLVLRAPGGFLWTCDLGSVTYPRFRTPVAYLCWTSLGSEFFDALYTYCGGIPRGPYTVTCYLNGMWAAEDTLTIQ